MNLPKIDITLNGVEYDHSFEDDVSIDRTNLDEEFSTQPTKYAFYAFLAEEAKYLADRQKAILENVYAAIDTEKRTNASTLLAQNPKHKHTEKMYENEVKGDARYKDTLEAYHKAKLLAGQLDVASRAIAMRRDMLMQMGATARLGAVPTRVMEAKRDNAKTIIAKQKSEPISEAEEEEEQISSKVATIADPQSRRRRRRE